MATCPPSSLFAPRYVTLPTFDLPDENGDGGGGSEGGLSAFGLSPLSPTRPWEEHIQEISRELEVICGSPLNRTKNRVYSHPPKRPLSLTRHPSTGCMFKSPPFPSTGPTLRSPALSSSPMASKAPMLVRTESQDREHMEAFGLYQRPETPNYHHRLVVRHEETPSRLTQQLARVCPLKCDEVLAKKPLSKYHFDAHILRRQTSYSSRLGVLYKVPLDQWKLEDLFVSLVDDHLLRVCADDTGSDAVVLEEVNIPTEVPVQSLMLSMMDDKWLYIQERRDGTMVADFTGTSARYVPVLRENEAASLIEIVLRIPAEFDADSITVKTVDDRIVVAGSKRPVTLTIGEEFSMVQGRVSPLTIGHVWSPPGVHFLVILPLPFGAESRTVSAYFTRPHQLLITGRLRPTLRRYTF